MTESSDALVPNPAVVGFFIAGAVITAFLGWRFAVAPVTVFRRFGLGLLCFAAAFVVWSAIVWVQPDGLQLWSTVGVAVLLPGYLFFLNAVAQDWQPRSRNLLLGGAVAYLVLLFIIRTFLLPSGPAFSKDGLFYFNAEPIVQLMYVIAFVGAALPAVYSVARSISVPWLSRATMLCFNLIVVCGVVLLTSYDDELQTYNGYLMGIAFLALLVIYLRHKPT